MVNDVSEEPAISDDAPVNSTVPPLFVNAPLFVRSPAREMVPEGAVSVPLSIVM